MCKYPDKPKVPANKAEGKRPWPPAGNATGGAPPGKKRYIQGNGAGVSALQPGLHGAMITCDVHVEREAIKEAFRLFETAIDTYAPLPQEAIEAPPPGGVGPTGTEQTAGDALAAELEAFKREKPDKSKFIKHVSKLAIAQTGCNGTVFVRFGEYVPMDCVTLVDRVMEDAASVVVGMNAPHVIRMMPIQATCSARTPEQIGEAAAPLLEKALSGFKGTYAVVWRRRCNNEIDKMRVIDVLAAAVHKVAPEAKVDLKDAEAAIVAEVIKTTCCLSVLPRWREFNQYNLRTHVHGGVSPLAPRIKEEPAAEAAAASAAAGASSSKA